MRVRLGLPLSVLLVSGALAAASAPPAGAALTPATTSPLGALLGATGLPGTTAPSLNAVFNTPNLFSILASVGCPVAKSLPSPPVPNQIPAVICALGELNYAYRTVYVAPDGTKVTRITRGVLGVPTLIDANGDGLPDFIGTVLPTFSGLGLTLDISRLGWFPGSAHVSVEAVALDPAAPQTYIGAGEDGLAAGTDSDWSATITFLSDSTDGTHISITQTNNGAPAAVATLGEFISGPNPDAPTNLSRGDVSFTPVPATLTTDVKLGQASQEAAVTSSAPSLVGAAVSLISPGDDKEIGATVNKLASSVDIHYTHPSTETKVTYSANAPVGQLSVQYHDTVNGSLQTAAALDASAVPTGLSVDQVSSQTAITTSGGAIGQVEARYASGRDVPAVAPGSGAYAAYHAYDDGSATAAVRLPDLSGLTLNAAEPFSGDLQLSAPLGYVGLSAQDDAKGYSVSGHLTGLPQHTTVGIDLASGSGGTVTFDGHGTGIGEIAADATDSKGTFFGRASRVDATIDNIPASDTIKFDDGGGQTTASASQPIGTISLLASDGSDAPPLTGSGVSLTDTPASFNAFARINGLKGLALSLGDAISGSIDTASQDPGCQGTGGQNLTLHAQTDSGTFDGAIDSLPSTVSFDYGTDASGNTTVDYNASAPIQRITADASGVSGLLAKLNAPRGGDILQPLDTIHAEIDCLPAHMTLAMDASGETSLNTYGSQIGELVAQVYAQQAGPATQADVGYPDASNAIEQADSGDQLAYYDLGSKGISVDLRKVGSFDFLDDSSGVLKLSDDLESTSPLAFAYHGGSPTELKLEGTLEHPQPGTLTVNSGTDGTISMQYAANGQSGNLSGSGALGQIAFDGFISSASGGSSYLQGVLANLPANLSVCLDYQTGVEDCGPPWVYPDSLDLGTDNPPQIFAVHVLPTDLTGAVPTTPLDFYGEFCFGSTLKSDCDKTGGGHGGGPPGVFIPGDKPLSFDSLWLGFGQKTDDCTLEFTCGRAWLGLDTTNQGGDSAGELTGQASYYENHDTDPLIKFNTDSGGYVAATEYYLWGSYSAGASTGFTEITKGSLSCGADDQESLDLNEGPGFDLLSGVFGICP